MYALQTGRKKERMKERKKVVNLKLRGKKFTVVTSPQVDRLPNCKHFFPVCNSYIPLLLIYSGFTALII